MAQALRAAFIAAASCGRPSSASYPLPISTSRYLGVDLGRRTMSNATIWCALTCAV